MNNIKLGINCLDGKETISDAVEVRPGFAIHKGITRCGCGNDRAGWWAVTHVPTGYACISYLNSKSLSVRIAKRFYELCGDGNKYKTPHIAASKMKKAFTSILNEFNDEL